jgi:hypothetical protein
MTRMLAVSYAFLVLAAPALGAGASNLASVTCKDYETSGHQDMVQLDAAFHDAAKGDPKLRSLSETEIGNTIDKVCAGHSDAKVMDVLGMHK